MLCLEGRVPRCCFEDFEDPHTGTPGGQTSRNPEGLAGEIWGLVMSSHPHDIARSTKHIYIY